ncbi:MAG: sigma-70 family RNA polymerase sigma factor [Clostridia bacterium]|nr:sigma-70 family RNA polymerase sigma factor [Clostridia bacterium]
MDDERIIDLYWQRKEAAITETKAKYGRRCYAIAYNILHDRSDAEECENDTYLDAWESMPPHKPTALSAFLGAITRRISLDKWRRKTAQKRGGEFAVSLEELEACIPDGKGIDEQLSTESLAETISAFLYTLPETECDVFLRRYWHFDSIRSICARYGFGQSKVKMMLLRTREKLQTHLEKEGFFV